VPPAPDGGSGDEGAPKLSLVVPTYNESTRLADGLDRLRAAAGEGALDLDTTELVLVDDGSTDDTLTIAHGLASQFPHARVVPLPRNSGKGAAVRAGILCARGSRVAFADADMAIDPSLLPSLNDALDRVPIAVGSRAVGGHVDYGTRVRTGAGRAFNLAVRGIGGVRLADTQCGFKGFRRGPALLLAHLQTTSGYAFDVELLWLADRLGLEIEIVPVTWLDVPGSTVRVARDSVRMLLDLVEVRRRRHVVSVVELTDVPSDPPDGTVVLRSGRITLLCGSVEDLAGLRRSVDGRGSPRLASLDELVALLPFELEPARV
jgi:glycosyltransferase involved in cell wall biosynthesis